LLEQVRIECEFWLLGVLDTSDLTRFDCSIKASIKCGFMTTFRWGIVPILAAMTIGLEHVGIFLY